MTDRCRALVEMMADPTDHRSRTEKFLAAGYSVSYGYVLTRTPEFIQRLRERATELTGGHLAEVFAMFLRDATESEKPSDRARAGRIIFEATGVIGPNLQVNVQTNVDIELSEEARARRIAEVRASRLVAPPIQDAGRPVRATRG